MPIAVAHASNMTEGVSVTSVTSSPTFASSTGNLLVFGAVGDSASGEGTTPISDGVNTWVGSKQANVGPDPTWLQMAYARNITGQSSQSATYTLSGSGYPTVCLLEVSGCDTVSPVDVAPAYQGAPSANPGTLNSSIITPTAGQRLIVVYGSSAIGTTANQSVSNAATATATPTWTTIVNNSVTGMSALLAYTIVTADGVHTYGVTYTNGVSGATPTVVGIAAFKVATGGGGTTYTLAGSTTQAQTPTTPILARRTVVGGTPTYHWDDATAFWDSGPIWDAQTAAHTGSVTQTETLSLARVLSLLRTVSATQTQSLSLLKQVRLARSLAQTQALALVRQITLVRATTQSQTVGLTLRQALARTLTASQAQVLALGKQVSLTRALTQAQALSLAAQKVFLRTLTLTQAQVASVVAQYISGGAQTYPITRSVTQAQALSLVVQKVFLRTVSATQTQALALAKQVRLARGVAQAQALSISLHQTLFRTLVATQAQLLSLVKQSRLARLLGQTQVASVVATVGARTYNLSGATSSHQSASLTYTVIVFVVPPPPVPVGVESVPPLSGTSVSNYEDWPVLIIQPGAVSGPPLSGASVDNYEDWPVVVVHPSAPPPPIGNAVGGP